MSLAPEPQSENEPQSPLPDAQVADDGLAHRLLFLAPGVVHGLSNSLFAVQGHAQILAAGTTAEKDPSPILRANEQAQTHIWFLRILLRDPGAPPAVQAGLLLRRLGDALKVPCRHRGLSVAAKDSTSQAPVLVAGAPFVDTLTDAVIGLINVVSSGFEGNVVLDLVQQDQDGVRVEVQLRPRTGMLPFPVDGPALCASLARQRSSQGVHLTPLDCGIEARFPAAPHPSAPS